MKRGFRKLTAQPEITLQKSSFFLICRRLGTRSNHDFLRSISGATDCDNWVRLKWTYDAPWLWEKATGCSLQLQRFEFAFELFRRDHAILSGTCNWANVTHSLNWWHPDTRESVRCFRNINTINDSQFSESLRDIFRRGYVLFRWTPTKNSCVEPILYVAAIKRIEAKV